MRLPVSDSGIRCHSTDTAAPWEALRWRVAGWHERGDSIRNISHQHETFIIQVQYTHTGDSHNNRVNRWRTPELDPINRQRCGHHRIWRIDHSSSQRLRGNRDGCRGYRTASVGRQTTSGTWVTGKTRSWTQWGGCRLYNRSFSVLFNQLRLKKEPATAIATKWRTCTQLWRHTLHHVFTFALFGWFRPLYVTTTEQYFPHLTSENPKPGNVD